MTVGALVLAAVEVVEVVSLQPQAVDMAAKEVKESPSWSFTHEDLCPNP
jgi:hypothetical protein